MRTLSKKHLYPVLQVLNDLDNNESINTYTFLCSSKEQALQCRGNNTNHTCKRLLKHSYKTELINSVNMNGIVYCFVILTKCI